MTSNIADSTQGFVREASYASLVAVHEQFIGGLLRIFISSSYPDLTWLEKAC